MLSQFLENYDTAAKLLILKEHLTPTLMLIIRRHPQLSDKVVGEVLEQCHHDQSLLSDMIESISKNDMALLFGSIWRNFRENGKKRSLLESPSFSNLVDELNNGLEDPEYALNSLRATALLAA